MTKIDTHDWKAFAIGDLFDVIKGTRLTKANMQPGKIRFIGSSSMNNGVTAHISNSEYLHPANTITVCYNGSVGEAFYQDQPFWASDDVNVLYPKFQLTLDRALFIIPLIKCISRKYNYINKWKQDVMCKDQIKLPVTSDGKPDWNYIDAYMLKMIRDTSITLNCLYHVVIGEEANDVHQ